MYVCNQCNYLGLSYLIECLMRKAYNTLDQLR